MFNGWYDRFNRPAFKFQGDVDTHQNDWELRALIDIYKDYSPQHVLEVGTLRGGTLYQWLTNATPDAHIINIENFYMLDYMTNKDFIKDYCDLWQHWCPPGVRLDTLVMDCHSDEALLEVKRIFHDRVDFLFIDADHSYEASFSDFNRYGALVAKGGIIALHDIKTMINRPNYRVWQLWSEIQQAGYVTRELQVTADGKGIGVIYV